MLAKRIIPCLDVTAGRVVKGVNFVNLRDAGDPVELADRYNQQGADEIVFLDITASSDNRNTMIDMVARAARKVFIPLAISPSGCLRWFKFDERCRWKPASAAALQNSLIRG